jgi:hypothetical protein
MLIPALLAARQEVSDWRARAAAFQAIFPHTPNVFAQVAELSQEKVTLLENYIEALQRVDLMMRQPRSSRSGK